MNGSVWPTTGSPASPITGFKQLPGGGSASGRARGDGARSVSDATAERALRDSEALIVAIIDV